uniref:BEN domain containing 5 n=1 Tax=Oncorhynchus mykiss TaxID=8022 RepID=A0A8C7M1D6_ONCMY
MEENVRDVDTGSEAGREEALVGNVNKLMVTPTGYTGVSRKSHLVFDACFESGNLGRVDCISEFEFDLFIRPDTCNPRFRVWFNFTVENVQETQRVIFNIVNFSKTKSLYRDGMSPVVKSTSRPKWQRLPAKNVYYYRCPDHRRNYVMSFAFCFDREDDVYQFAYCYPYTYTRLQHYLDSLERRNLDYLQREQLGLSVQQRRLDLLTITSPAKQKKLVVLTARVHPGESPASFICQGVIDFLVSQHPVAVILRDHVIFKIVPMLNPDGVYLGNYRCSLMGFDLNRHWQEPSPWVHPTLHAVKQLIVQLSQDAVSPNLQPASNICITHFIQ